MPHQISADVRRVIDDCVECHSVCTETVSHCLQLGGEHVSAEHIRLLLDCANACQASAESMLLGSEFQRRLCAVCAEICEACAKSCERIAGDDSLMKRCAEICRRCAASCREMGGKASKAA